MQELRNAKTLARLVLVWFALTVGAAIASPLVRPQAMDLICSGAGLLKLQPKTNGGDSPAPAKLLDCPLCIAASAPPPARCQTGMSDPASSYAIAAWPAAFVASTTAAPPPARGPPAVS